MTPEEIAAAIRNADTWNDDLNRALCDAAGMLTEYEQADGDTFEAIVYQAADKLHVAI